MTVVAACCAAVAAAGVYPSPFNVSRSRPAAPLTPDALRTSTWTPPGLGVDVELLVTPGVLDAGPVDEVLPATVVAVVVVEPVDTAVPLLESNDFAIKKMPSAAAPITSAIPRKLRLSAPRRGPSGSRGGRRMLMALP